jgi:hypothetical protein
MHIEISYNKSESRMNATQPCAPTIPQARRQWFAVALAISLTSCVHTGPPGSLCEQPAAVEGHLDSAAPGTIVIVRENANVAAVAARLTKTYHIELTVLRTLHGFTVQTVTDEMVASLRCEPDIESISYDQLLHNVTLNRSASEHQ